MSSLKKHQHYVWKKYLRPWTLNNQICCLRNGKVFKTSLKNIGQKRFFYQSIVLGSEEIKFLKALQKNAIPNVAKSMSLILELYNDIANSEHHYQMKCGIEDLHEIIEKYGGKHLANLYTYDTQFFNNSKERHEFSLFLGVQYSRTNRMRQNLDQKILQNNRLNLEKLSVILPFIYGEIIGKWIYDVAKLKILLNNTDINLVTGDQPIYNATVDPSNSNPPTKFELFYPISPKIAIYLSKSNEGRSYLTEKEVRYYNTLTAQNSYEQIYGKTAHDLKHL